MNIKPLHSKFQEPVLASDLAGGYDLFMPQGGKVRGKTPEGVMAGLGFAAAVPKGHVALLLPRSGVGAKHGLALNNTCGVIDSDYRGEWIACLRTHNNRDFQWDVGDRLLQMIIVPVKTPKLHIVGSLDETQRAKGGFGSTGTSRKIIATAKLSDGNSTEVPPVSYED